MCDVVVKLDVSSDQEDALLMSVVHSFIEDKHVEHSTLDAPSLMLRPTVLPSGKLGKAVVFQDPSWADAFKLFWEERKMQAAIA